MGHSTPRRPLRLWPGVLIVALQWLTMFGLPIVAPAQGAIAVIAGPVGGLIVLLWWLLFSREPWPERVGAIVLMVVSVAIASRLVHASITNGMMGAMLFIYAAPPVMGLALVTWAAASRGLPSGYKRVALVVAMLLACGALTLVRTNGINGDSVVDLAWRWTPTAEQRLLALANDTVVPPSISPAANPPENRPPNQPSEPVATPTSASPVAETPEKRGLAAAGEEETGGAATLASVSSGAAWPGFRGPARDSIVRGVRIDTDWARTPPVELWRRPIGPGWSSFAVAGDLLFTQEQRGDDEVVSAYNLKTGAPVWRHSDAARFWESNAGAGPRGTPTLSAGRVYTLGGTGILNALDARDGKAIWSRNAAADAKKSIPDWGISSSPVVSDDVVIVGVAGQLVAYELATGKPKWFGPVHGGSYSSPHLMTFDGVAQILQPNGVGVTSVSPADGTLLWEHKWEGTTILQPAQMPEGDVLLSILSGAGGAGTRRLAVTHAPSGWTAEERWTSTGLKPYFNDFVVHNGHAFGFDGAILASIDLSDGTRKWKGGRYGHGQMVLLPEQNLLLVLSEEGELALVSATADKFTELARFPAIEGKTWNHPVLVGDTLVVRNGEEMAAFRLSLAR
ncbi:MAG TPA: PQQ-binding-like beta-propeller repeat protein [Vicinamibacterales bacterium]|nr:PQQ-binding-like beta-propeller repeat protein [Vicinamibacterales bacterium]